MVFELIKDWWGWVVGAGSSAFFLRFLGPVIIDWFRNRKKTPAEKPLDKQPVNVGFLRETMRDQNDNLARTIQSEFKVILAEMPVHMAGTVRDETKAIREENRRELNNIKDTHERFERFVEATYLGFSNNINGVRNEVVRLRDDVSEIKKAVDNGFEKGSKQFADLTNRIETLEQPNEVTNGNRADN